MNPEFERNLWLELTPRRLMTMAILLALVFFAAALSGDADYGPAFGARWLYYAIVVAWGARNAAMSVVGEIRERTWDLQRLSSLDPSRMVWGKLFGATSYNWFGGAICLAVIASDAGVHQGVLTALIDIVYLVAIGVIAQAAALLASLIAIRRRQTLSRLSTFLHQMVGIAAAVAVFAVWSIADPAGSILTHKPPADFVVWWGVSLDARAFLLVSLAIFAVWTLVACYRAMRLELKMRNGPFVWLGFLAFIGLYVAGFDAWLPKDPSVAGWDAAALRLGLAATTFGTLAYIMVVLEPKDRVLYRRLGNLIASGRIGVALGGFQAWMMSYAATAIIAVVTIVWLEHLHMPSGQIALIVALLGFLTRDTAVFVAMQTLPGRRRGDYAALGILFALYILAPAICRGLGLDGAMVLFFAKNSAPAWLGAAVAWAEGLAVAAFAAGRLALTERSVKAA
jgi:hypothetical protein